MGSQHFRGSPGMGFFGKGEGGRGIIPLLGRLGLSLAAESAWRVPCQLLQLGLSTFSEPSDTGKAGQGTGTG